MNSASKVTDVITQFKTIYVSLLEPHDTIYDQVHVHQDEKIENATWFFVVREVSDFVTKSREEGVIRSSITIHGIFFLYLLLSQLVFIKSWPNDLLQLISLFHFDWLLIIVLFLIVV